MIELLVEFWPILIVAMVAIMVAAFIACAPIYGVVALCTNLHEKLLRDDAEHFLRSKLNDLQDWKPSSQKLERFLHRELASPNQIGYDLSTLREFTCYLLANGEESSLVIGTNGENTNYLWLRFRWKDEWWILWHDSRKAAKYKNAFRAFPESYMESEVYQEAGLIINIRTISYTKVRSYY